jgi:hypothetical protein
MLLSAHLHALQMCCILNSHPKGIMTNQSQTLIRHAYSNTCSHKHAYTRTHAHTYAHNSHTYIFHNKHTDCKHSCSATGRLTPIDILAHQPRDSKVLEMLLKDNQQVKPRDSFAWCVYVCVCCVIFGRSARWELRLISFAGLLFAVHALYMVCMIVAVTDKHNWQNKILAGEGGTSFLCTTHPQFVRNTIRSNGQAKLLRKQAKFYSTPCTCTHT